MKSINIFKKETNNLLSTYNRLRINLVTKKDRKRLNLMREMMLVRLISAFEFYLIENIKEIFLITKEPFKNYGFEGIKNSHLLGFNSIEQLHSAILFGICRNLTKKGLSEIDNFYGRILNISFKEIQDKTKSNIEEYYDKRHLLVHALGKTDKNYQIKYSTSDSKVKIDDPYLQGCFKNMHFFVTYLNELLDSVLLVHSAPKDEIIPEREISITFKANDKILKLLDKNYRFWVDDELVSAGSLVVSQHKTDNLYKVSLAGRSRVIRLYLRFLKRAVKKYKTEINIDEQTYNPRNPFRILKLSMEDVQVKAVKSKLPNQPWEKGIHKKIAEELQIPKKKVSDIISYLIISGIFKHQIDGVVQDSLPAYLESLKKAKAADS